MREILFRGKTYEDEWAQGTYYHQKEFYGDETDFHYIIESCDQLEDNIMNFSGVIPETIGQYTGLTDKNGTKIFEGDICQIKGISYIDETPFVVEWNSEYSGWFWRDVNIAAATDTITADITKNAKVIGNIHDNPELLESEVDTE